MQFGTANDDEVTTLAIDAKGNVYVSGYEGGIVGLTNIEPTGNAKAITVKFNPAGEFVWKDTLDTAGTDVCEALKIDSASGDIYIAGRTSGAIPGSVNKGQFDLFIRLLSETGEVHNTFQDGNERPQHPRQIDVTSTGGILVAGYDDVYVPANYVESWEDSFVAKFNVESAPGSPILPQWWYQYSTSASDYITGLVADSNGDVFVSGAQSQIGKGPFVTQFHSDGTPGWSKKISKSLDDYAFSVALSPAGALYVVGATILKMGDASFGQQDAFVIKLDKSNGDIIWIKQIGSDSADWPTAIVFDKTGNIYLAGISLGSFVEGSPNKGGDDLFVLKLDDSGNILKAWQRGTNENDYAAGLQVDACGNVFLAGYTDGQLFDDQPSSGGRDSFLLKVDF